MDDSVGSKRLPSLRIQTIFTIRGLIQWICVPTDVKHVKSTYLNHQSPKQTYILLSSYFFTTRSRKSKNRQYNGQKD